VIKTSSENGSSNAPQNTGYFGGLTPAEAGKKSQEVQRGRTLEIPENIKKMGPELLKELVQAAYGRGQWHKLTPDKRLMALFKANEYVNGRPRQADPDQHDPDEVGFRVGKA
jgi:hypothetical protein